MNSFVAYLWFALVIWPVLSLVVCFLLAAVMEERERRGR